MKEKKLITALKAGEDWALGECIDEYSVYLAALVRQLAGDSLSREDREDIIADSFCALWYSRETLRDSGLKTYLAALARNKTIDFLRKRKIYIKAPEDFPAAFCRGPERESLINELAEAAREALMSLPEPDREIFRRCYFLCESSSEIGRVLNIKPASVRTRLARGRERLRKYLAERGFEDEDIYV